MNQPVPTRTQLTALVRLRWAMIRSRSLRISLATVGLLPSALVIVGMLGLDAAPDEQTVSVALATPTLYLGFVILAVLTPLMSGGGYELYPPDQLVAYPVTPATVFRGTLLLAPVNLAWILNVIALFVVTGFAAGPIQWAPTARSLATVAAFIIMATIAGHALGWFVMGLRQSRGGRILTNTCGGVVIVVGLLVLWTDKVIALLDASPTRYILFGTYDAYLGRYGRWALVMAAMIVVSLLLIRLGEVAAAWALRRPGDHADRTGSRSLPRRRPRSGAVQALVDFDHASLWRSTPLRRGMLVLMLVPGLVSLLAGLSWQSLVLVPGLIAAGAGLLFGINAFTLDSTGAVWLSTLPNWSQPAFLSKTLVFAEVSLAAVTSALIGGSLRAPAPAHAGEVTAAICSALSCAAIVVALGMRSSVMHPNRADLTGPRDTPATPGVMAAQSVRFAVATTFASLTFGGLALMGEWWPPVLGAVVVLCGAGLHLISTARAWGHPHVRAHVVMKVAGG